MGLLYGRAGRLTAKKRRCPARAVSLQHGVSAMGQKNLEAHILAQVKESTLLYARSHAAPHTNPRIKKSGEA
jgi:hypothetical protein